MIEKARKIVINGNGAKQFCNIIKQLKTFFSNSFNSVLIGLNKKMFLYKVTQKKKDLEKKLKIRKIPTDKQFRVGLLFGWVTADPSPAHRNG